MISALAQGSSGEAGDDPGFSVATGFAGRNNALHLAQHGCPDHQDRTGYPCRAHALNICYPRISQPYCTACKHGFCDARVAAYGFGYPRHSDPAGLQAVDKHARILANFAQIYFHARRGHNAAFPGTGRN